MATAEIREKRKKSSTIRGKLWIGGGEMPGRKAAIRAGA